MTKETAIKLFEEKQVRSTWDADQEKWYISIVDVIEILTGTDRPRKYWSDLKSKLKKEGSQLSEKIGQLKLEASDGKKYSTDCANTETMFRIVQSIPSPKAEPFKRWLAKVGYERIQEIDDPELGTKRTRALYKAKGYPDDWIENRMRGIAIREDLTNEWQKRGVEENREYAILTAEIHEATFGLKPGQHKKLKGLEQENLRDHMTNLEQIFTMLGEASTTEIARTQDTKGFDENKHAAKVGGKIAGNARKELEEKTGNKVISRKNYLNLKTKPLSQALENKDRLET